MSAEEAALVKEIPPLSAAWQYLNSSTAAALVERAEFFLVRSDDVEKVVDSVVDQDNIILLHGVTGVGKSALTLRLKTQTPAEDFVGVLEEAAEAMSAVEHETKDGQVIALGDGRVGCTIVPNRIDVGSTVILDMPGLQDNDPTHVFSIGVVHRLLMRDMAKCQIACVVPVTVFVNPNQLLPWMDAWREALMRMVGDNLTTFRTGMECVTFILNRVDELADAEDARFSDDVSYNDMCKNTQDLILKAIAAASAVGNPFNLRLLQQVRKSFVLVDYYRHDADFIASKIAEVTGKITKGRLRQAATEHFGHVGSKEADEAASAGLMLKNARQGVATKVSELLKLSSAAFDDLKTVMDERAEIMAKAEGDVKSLAAAIVKLDADTRLVDNELAQLRQNLEVHVEDVARRQHSLDFVTGVSNTDSPSGAGGAVEVMELRCVVVRSTANGRSHTATLTACVEKSTHVVAFSGENTELRKMFQNEVASGRALVESITRWRAAHAGGGAQRAAGATAILLDTAANSCRADGNLKIVEGQQTTGSAAVCLTATYPGPFTLCVFYPAASKHRTVQLLARGLQDARKTHDKEATLVQSNLQLQEERTQQREELVNSFHRRIEACWQELDEWKQTLALQEAEVLSPLRLATTVANNLEKLYQQPLWKVAAETMMFLEDHGVGSSTDLPESPGDAGAGAAAAKTKKTKKNGAGHTKTRLSRRGRAIRKADAVKRVERESAELLAGLRNTISKGEANLRKAKKVATSSDFLVPPSFPMVPVLKRTRAAAARATAGGGGGAKTD